MLKWPVINKTDGNPKTLPVHKDAPDSQRHKNHACKLSRLEHLNASASAEFLN